MLPQVQSLLPVFVIRPSILVQPLVGNLSFVFQRSTQVRSICALLDSIRSRRAKRQSPRIKTVEFFQEDTFQRILLLHMLVQLLLENRTVLLPSFALKMVRFVEKR